MLQLRPNCECCARDLPPDSDQAYICSFECTWCTDCAVRILKGVCPNCRGELSRRPARPVALLDQYPPATERVLSQHPDCITRREKAA